MKLKNLVIPFFLLLIGCADYDKQTENPSLKNLQVVKADTFMIGSHTFHMLKLAKNEYEKLVIPAFDTSEVRNLQKDSALVKRSGDTLIFKIANGKTVTLADNKNTYGDSYADYDYMGYLGDIKHYVVFGAFYEWYNYLIISEKTGDTLVLRGEPVLSPDKKLVVAGNSDLFAGFTENGLELYSVENEKIKLIGTNDLTNWGVKEIKWKNNKELWVKRSVMDSVNAGHEYTDYMSLIIE